MSITIKLSGRFQGLTLIDLTQDKAKAIIDSLMGVTGIKRMHIEWSTPTEPTKQCAEEPKTIKYPEKECGIIDTTPSEYIPLNQLDQPQEQTEPPEKAEPLNPFYERPKTSKKDLGPYIALENFNIGYHDQPGTDEIIICLGTTKVYTTIGDVLELAYPIIPEQIAALSITKQAAIKRFKVWVEQVYKPHLGKYPENLLGDEHDQRELPDKDQDAEFRTQLPPGMISTSPAAADGGSIDGPLPE